MEDLRPIAHRVNSELLRMHRIDCRSFEQRSTSQYSSIYGHRFHRWFYLQFAAARVFARGAASFAPLANFTTYFGGAGQFLNGIFAELQRTLLASGPVLTRLKNGKGF